jgi:hypothetical protein
MPFYFYILTDANKYGLDSYGVTSEWYLSNTGMYYPLCYGYRLTGNDSLLDISDLPPSPVLSEPGVI